MSFFKNLNSFKMLTPAQIRAKQQEEAERAILEHEASAEYHDAMATLCRARLERLRATEQQHLAIDFKTGRRIA